MSPLALVGALALFRREGEPEGAEISVPSMPAPAPSPPPTPRPDVIVDPGEPEPFTFRGAGSPTVAVVTSLFSVNRRLVVDALRPKPPPGPPPPPPPGPPPPPPPRSFVPARMLP